MVHLVNEPRSGAFRAVYSSAAAVPCKCLQSTLEYGMFWPDGLFTHTCGRFVFLGQADRCHGADTPLVQLFRLVVSCLLAVWTRMRFYMAASLCTLVAFELPSPQYVFPSPVGAAPRS